jgi:hypothetical protein
MKYCEFNELIEHNRGFSNWSLLQDIFNKQFVKDFFMKNSHSIDFQTIQELCIHFSVEGDMGDGDFGLLNYVEFVDLLRTKIFNNRKVDIYRQIFLEYTTINVSDTAFELMVFYDNEEESK